jgi:hypothetical protein
MASKCALSLGREAAKNALTIRTASVKSNASASQVQRKVPEHNGQMQTQYDIEPETGLFESCEPEQSNRQRWRRWHPEAGRTVSC